MNNKVFISHARKDNEAAKELVEKLKDKGIHSWLDQYEIKPGESWEQQIKAALIESETVVLVLGEGAPSPNVLVEAGMAFGQGKRVLPVLIGESANINVFSNLQQVRAIGSNGIEEAADQIVNVISDPDEIL